MDYLHLRVKLRIDSLQVFLQIDDLFIKIPLLILKLINFAPDLSLNLLTFLFDPFSHFSILFLLKLFELLFPNLVLSV